MQPDILSLTVVIVGVRFFALSRAVLRYLERLVSHDASFRYLSEVRVRFFSRLEPLVPNEVGGARTGDLLSRFVADVDALQHLLVRVIAPPVAALVVGVGAVAVAAVLAPRRGLRWRRRSSSAPSSSRSASSVSRVPRRIVGRRSARSSRPGWLSS